MIVRALVHVNRVRTTEDFANARHARAYVQGVAKTYSATLEGTGNEGVFVTGRGSAKKRIGYYEIELV